jgi:hypothetical protein
VPNQFSLAFKNLVKKLLTVDAKKRPTIEEVIADPLIAKNAKRLMNEDDFNQEFRKSMQHAQNVFEKTKDKLEA